MNREPLKKLKAGVGIPAVPLVLDENRQFDESKQRRLVRYYLSAGAGGLAAAVHTTQFEIRDPKIDLFEKLLKVVKVETLKYEQKTGDTIVLIAGVCGPTKQADKETLLAKNLGYDAVLLSPGGLGYLSESELLERTEIVSNIMPVVGFYLQPSVGGRVFTYDYWEKFCEIDNVAAIKTAPFNRYQTLDVVRAVAFSSRKDKIALYTGNDDNILIDIMSEYSFKKDGRIHKVNYVGGLLGHWAVWTHTAIKYFNMAIAARKSGSISNELMKLAIEITDSNSAFFDAANNFKGCIVGLHEVLRRQGLMDGVWTLNENDKLSSSQQQEIDRIYEMYPHLNDDAFVKEFLLSQI